MSISTVDINEVVSSVNEESEQMGGKEVLSEGGHHLLLRVANREPEAFETCIQQYGNLVWALAKRYSPCQSDAEDAVQEIFLDLWKKAEKFTPERSCESTFITMIARRKLIDRHRKLGRSVETTSIGNDWDQPDLSPASRPYELIDEAAKASLCLENLQANHRDILKRSIHQGQSHSQISSDLSMPLGSVKSLARRGLIQLRQCMERFMSTSQWRVST